MKLYFSPGACSLSRELSCSKRAFHRFATRRYQNQNAGGGGDYWAITDKGYVPALQLDSGEVITEGQPSCSTLADLKPEAGLAPANGTVARVKLQEMLNYITSEVHKTLGSMFDPGFDDNAKSAS